MLNNVHGSHNGIITLKPPVERNWTLKVTLFLTISKKDNVEER